MQGDGKAEITVKQYNKEGKEIEPLCYKVWWNKMALAEAYTKFGIEGFEWIHSPIQIAQVLWCGILAAGNFVKYDTWFGYFENDLIDAKRLEPAITAFKESTLISGVIAEQQKAIDAYEKEQKNVKKKQERDSLKKGK
jgi:hypothetical protein